MGKAYHPSCFTCVVCHRGLDGIPFTVDATSQIHCIEDFHRSGWVSHLCFRMSDPPHLPHFSFMAQYQPLRFPTSGFVSFYYPSLSLLRSKTIPLASPVPLHIPPFLGSTVSPLQLRGLIASLVPFPPRKFAPRCSVCGGAIMPEPGQEETVRIVALDRSFHIGCYKCEVRGPGQGGRGGSWGLGCWVW